MIIVKKEKENFVFPYSVETNAGKQFFSRKGLVELAKKIRVVLSENEEKLVCQKCYADYSTKEEQNSMRETGVCVSCGKKEFK